MHVVVVRAEAVSGISCASIARANKTVICLPADQITQAGADALAAVLSATWPDAAPLPRAASA